MLHDGSRSPVPEKEMRLLFRDVADHLLRVIDHVESYDRLLTDVLNAHLAPRSAVQQNSDMRKISAWVAIAAVPTMIAGIYGMNFEQHARAAWHVRATSSCWPSWPSPAGASTARSAGPAGSDRSPGSAGQVALTTPVASRPRAGRPRATRYQTNAVIEWLRDEPSSQAIEA